MSGPRILVLDIESSPILGYSWGIWQQNIEPMKQIVEPPRMLCYGAKWHGERKKFFASEYHDGRIPMLESIAHLLDEADFVVGWNSARFDRPWINGEIDKEGVYLPSPSTDIDLMKVAKKELRLPSYKLDYVAQKHYGLPGKVTHQGFQLWRDVIEGDEATKAKAWRQMKRYQLGDVDVTDAVLTKMARIIRLLPNPALFSADGAPENCSTPGCPGDLRRRGFAYTTVGAYPRYRCHECGRWMKGKTRERSVSLRGIS
jgi:hypothetical protein